MFLERIKQKYRTLNWPASQPALSDRYRGKPQIKNGPCGSCQACYTVCPTHALVPRKEESCLSPGIDLGRCIFCGACATSCPHGYFTFTQDYHMATGTRSGLIVHPQEISSANETSKARDAAVGSLKIFKKSFKLRQVSAGGCNACEADCNVLGTLVYDLGRFGCEFTASPRHADGLALTGPVSLNMLPALADTWAAIAHPKFFLAVGACAISGGLFDGCACAGGIDGIFANSEWQKAFGNMNALIYVPGCPPNPWTILDGILSIRNSSLTT